MKSVRKLVIASLTFIFSQSASAVIIEVSFWGQLHELYYSNMEGTPDEKFFTNENSFNRFFSGTFWYDTDLAGPAVNSTDIGGFVSATYSGRHDWLHATSA